MAALWQFNYMLFQDVNSQAGQHPWFDALMIFCANFLIFCWPLLLLIVWGIPLAWRNRPLQQHQIEMLQARRAAVLWIGIACLLAYIINLLIEQFVFEPRPFVSHKVHLLISHAADSSFPSDHTAWSFAVVGMLLFAFMPIAISAWREQSGIGQKKELGLLRMPLLLLVVALVIACSIGLARVYVGIHYPDDVIGGAIDGLAAAYLVTVLRQWLHRPTDAVLRFARTLRLA